MMNLSYCLNRIDERYEALQKSYNPVSRHYSIGGPSSIIPESNAEWSCKITSDEILIPAQICECCHQKTAKERITTVVKLCIDISPSNPDLEKEIAEMLLLQKRQRFHEIVINDKNYQKGEIK